MLHTIQTYKLTEPQGTSTSERLGLKVKNVAQKIRFNSTFSSFICSTNGIVYKKLIEYLGLNYSVLICNSDISCLILCHVI